MRSLASFATRVCALGAMLSGPWPGAQTDNQAFIPASAAALNIGKTTVVCGVVAAVRTTRDADLLDLDAEIPKQALTVIVQATGRFDAATRARAKGLQVCAGGRIERDPTGAVIKMTDLKRLRAVPGAIARPPDFPGIDAVDLTGGHRVPGLTEPRPHAQPEPKYTSLAMGAGISGDVRMEMVIRADGTAGPIRVASSLDALYGLDDEPRRRRATCSARTESRSPAPGR